MDEILLVISLIAIPYESDLVHLESEVRTKRAEGETDDVVRQALVHPNAATEARLCSRLLEEVFL